MTTVNVLEVLGNPTRRYSAEDFSRVTGRLPAKTWKDVELRNMMRQAQHTEATVMGLVEAFEKIEIAASHGATQIVRDLAREALSKFIGEDHA